MLQLTENQQLNDYTTLALTTAPTFNTVQTEMFLEHAYVDTDWYDIETGYWAF